MERSDYSSHVQAGGVPLRGQVVYLGPAASPQFAAHPVHLQLTEDAVSSAIDLSEGRPNAADALWLLLRGWELDSHGRRAIERAVGARAAGIVIVHQSPAVRP